MHEGLRGRFSGSRAALGTLRLQSGMYGDPDRIHETMLAAHQKAVIALKSGPGKFAVGIALAIQDEQAAPGGEGMRDRVRTKLYDDFLDLATRDDFVGVQTYTKNVWTAGGLLPWPEGTEMTQMDYPYAPEALEFTLRYAWKRANGRPLIVTENGIGTANDRRRIDFINTALRGVGNCLADNIDIQGYVHWSLLDNFEWESGYKIRRPRRG